jgi:heptosyltransferase I
VLISGASRAEKLWPDGHWLEVAATLRERGCRLVWFWGSAAERDRALRLAHACGSVVDAGGAPDASVTGGMDGTGGAGRAAESPVLSVVPPFLSVADAAGLLASAAVVVGLDTGFTHLAGALGRPTVAIFCDFDAMQCAVSGDGHCESFGGIGQVPAVATVGAGVLRALDAGPFHGLAAGRAPLEERSET